MRTLFNLLGPLTNLALALKLDPTLPSRVPRLVIMGGAVTGLGRVDEGPPHHHAAVRRRRQEQQHRADRVGERAEHGRQHRLGRGLERGLHERHPADQPTAETDDDGVATHAVQAGVVASGEAERLGILAGCQGDDPVLTARADAHAAACHLP